ncbi:MAG: methyltransferase domain-containing protein [Anaerolineae bacterium]|jgi:ubiquinone/menaquinone biosynthesis C-methylase UbiE|nr:methyltransferase domain-containing protein [Anaerolineae bacterium]
MRLKNQPCEAEIAPGLEPIVSSELADESIAITHTEKGLIQFTYTGELADLRQLKTVNALYLRYQFPIPRPKALLGHQHFQILLNAITRLQQAYPPETFRTLGIDAAGSDSSVMQRLKTELATAAHLYPDTEKGDLLLRIRRTRDQAEGWDVLIRISPRPLATRAWRVQDYEGALNAAVAHAMIRLTRPSREDRYLNLACGSGTLLIERLTAGRAQQVIGIDHDPFALSLAQRNSTASKVKPQLLQGDVRALPLSDASIDKLTADLPFGQLVGTHEANRTLYPDLLQEAARVARIGAPFVLITHEIRLLENLLRQQSAWHLEDLVKITLNGLHPRIYLLRRV